MLENKNNFFFSSSFRYVSLLSEHRRIILCGPSGTGKSYLANKLSQYLVQREGREATPEVIATFK
jgi:neuron navigator 2